MRNTLFLLLFCALASSMPATAADDEAAQKGLEIMTEAKKRTVGWKNSQANLEMILRNKRGDESQREMRIKALEVENDGDKSLIIFDTPRDVQNTAFLSFSHPLEPDDQWLYLPALKRVKRISSRNKSGPFMGSEFSYEDMSSFEVEKYTYKYLRDETVDGEAFFVVEAYPVDELSGYTRQVVWIDQDEYRFRKADFYDRKDALLKTLTTEDFEQYLGFLWRPGKQHMTNHQTGKSTDLFVKDLEFGVDLDDADFNRNALKRAR